MRNWHPFLPKNTFVNWQRDRTALRDTMARQNMGEGYLDETAFKALIAHNKANFKQPITRLDIKS